MDNKYIAQCRYEWLSKNGKIWTEWFPVQMTPFSEENKTEVLKQLKKATEDIDKKTKLKHEYREYLLSDYEKFVKDIKKKAEVAKADFKTIEKMKRPWAKESRKMIKKLREMSNAEKVEWKAKQNSENHT